MFGMPQRLMVPLFQQRSGATSRDCLTQRRASVANLP
jgi:hypothetical protein